MRQLPIRGQGKAIVQHLAECFFAIGDGALNDPTRHSPDPLHPFRWHSGHPPYVGEDGHRQGDRGSSRVDTPSRPCFIESTAQKTNLEGLMDGIVDYLLANPLFLIPILLLAAMMIYAALKKLLKMAAIVAIAGGLYLGLMQYFGGGF